MPIDFRTYTDPGVFIEAITPPVVFTAAIEPTIVAIVGDADEARTVFGSENLYTADWTDLTPLGGDPSTLEVKGKWPLDGVQYVSAAIGTLDATISSGATSLSINLFDADWIEPTASTFVIQIEDEQITITTASGTVTSGVYAVTGAGRAANSTVAAAHSAGQIANDVEQYATTASLEVGSLYGYITATNTSIEVTELYGVQVITTSGAVGYGTGDSFKLTYGGAETIAFVHGTNATSTDIQNGLIGLSTIDAAGVTVTGSTNTGPWTVKFLSPNTDVTALTVTSPSGYTGSITVANRGVTDGSYLDIEGERMIVTDVSGTAPQTVTVTRGAAATPPASHNVNTVIYENSGADYLVKVGVGTDTDLLTGDDTTSVKILSRIGNGDLVSIKMNVTDAEQFSVGMFDDLDTIRDKYGDPLDEFGAVASELTLGAQIAMANGATQLMLVATDSNDSNPVQEALSKLQFEQVVNSIVILSGNAADISYLKGHVEQLSDQGLLRRAFVGLDGTTLPVPNSTDFINKALSMSSERVSLVAPSQFKLDNGTGTPVIVPGYFGAAAVAGLQAHYGPATPLTRKQVFGFVGINDQDTNQNTFQMQASGVLVLFEDRFGRLIVKHGLTTNMASVYTREISIVTARDRLRDFIMDTLESGELIGSPMDVDTPNLVMSAIEAALEESVAQGLIFDYANTVYRFPTENPSMIEVRFSYKPTLPLNYILVEFSIDTNVGTVQFQSINDNTEAQG